MTGSDNKPAKKDKPRNIPPVQSVKKVKKAGEMLRSGKYKQAEICKTVGISTRTLTNWISRFDWKPDLSEQVRIETQRKMINSVIDERQAIEDASNEQVAVLTKHKRILDKALHAIDKTISELVPENDEKLAIEICKSDPDEQKTTAIQRSAALNQLVAATSKIIADQRKTYRIDAETKGSMNYEDLLFEALEGPDGSRPEV